MKQKVFIGIAVLAFLVSFVIALVKVFSGNIAFWFDPARDLLLALANIQKPSLIGPPSGIPNIFYGPYWIWFLSLSLLISKDPRLVTFFVQILPYFIVLPVILWKLQGIFKKSVLLSIWSLFMLSSGIEYATKLWNPNLAPLLVFVLVYLIVFIDYRTFKKNDFLKNVLSGFIAGLLINIHISFGFAVVVATYLYFIVSLFLNRDRTVKISLYIHTLVAVIVSYSVGLGVAFLPFMLFEFKHGFNQSKTILKLLSHSNIEGVALHGMTQLEILKTFLSKSAELFHFYYWIGLLVLIFAVVSLALQLKNKRLTKKETKIFIFISCAIVTTLGIYLSAHNPIWDYHFIGTEVLVVLLIALAANRNKWLRFLLLFALVFVNAKVIHQNVLYYSHPPENTLSLRFKENVVQTIKSDAGGREYTVFIYSQAIYTYDYSYTFLWKADKNIPFDPTLVPRDKKLVYLIIPQAWQEIADDFINFRTPNEKYYTSYQWNFYDGTRILKREQY